LNNSANMTAPPDCGLFDGMYITGFPAEPEKFFPSYFLVF
jgi:hypothetical protein